MRSSDGRPARLTRQIGVALAIAAGTVLLGAAPPPSSIPGRVLQFADAPSQGNGGIGGAGGLDAFGILLLVGLGLAVLAAIAAGFVLFRTRGAKAVPSPSEGWWTCANCGAGNMDGAPRCHNCATWRSTTTRSTNPAP